MQHKKVKLAYNKCWRFEALVIMDEDDTYIFTTNCGVTIFVDRNCNLNKKTTYGWNISVFDKEMEDLAYFEFETLNDLKANFKRITHEIKKYIDETPKKLKSLEDILQKLTNNNGKVFKEGKLTEQGNIAYNKLTEILYGLENVCDGAFDPNAVVDELDKITN